MNPKYCTLETCSLEDAYMHYRPSIPGCIVYIALYGLLLVIQTIQCPIYRMWGFSGSMVIGLTLDIIGYVARILFHGDPFNFDYFLMNLICLGLAPIFYCAALYFLLGRVVTVYRGEDISRLRPRNYAIVFVSCDVFALILQGAGGAITSSAPDDNPGLRDTGVNLMIAGLAFQVATLTLFISLAVEFAYRLIRRERAAGQNDESKDEYAALREGKTWKGFIMALVLATITVYIRSIYRVVELNGGFDSAVANDEVAFMVLEGAMVSITCICLTVMHPGMALQTRRAKVNCDVDGGL